MKNKSKWVSIAIVLIAVCMIAVVVLMNRNKSNTATASSSSATSSTADSSDSSYVADEDRDSDYQMCGNDDSTTTVISNPDGNIAKESNIDTSDQVSSGQDADNQSDLKNLKSPYLELTDTTTTIYTNASGTNFDFDYIVYVNIAKDSDTNTNLKANTLLTHTTFDDTKEGEYDVVYTLTTNYKQVSATLHVIVSNDEADHTSESTEDDEATGDYYGEKVRFFKKNDMYHQYKSYQNICPFTINGYGTDDIEQKSFYCWDYNYDQQITWRAAQDYAYSGNGTYEIVEEDTWNDVDQGHFVGYKVQPKY